MSENTENRLKQHNSGKTTSTKAYRPWVLVYKEKLDSRIEARKREKYFKSGTGREYIRRIILASWRNEYLPAGRQGAPKDVRLCFI